MRLSAVAFYKPFFVGANKQTELKPNQAQKPYPFVVEYL
jgi:hypothetical protein